MKVFVTGHRGYIGSHLVDVLKQAGHHVTGCDVDLFAGCAWQPVVPPDKELIEDIRKIEVQDLDGHDCIMHLAAISNDPMGSAFEEATFNINYRAAVNLAKAAKASGARSFVFASSCSVYGCADSQPRRETDELDPLTAYSRSKISTKNSLEEIDDGNFVVTCLRFPTACGMSDRLRLDLVLNDFVASAIATGEV